MVDESADVPPDVLARLRAACLALPDAYEEQAWTGTRWRVRGRTFAHVLVVDPEHQRAHARAAGADGPVCVLTFRAAGEEIGGLVGSGPPFFKVEWGPNVVGLVIDDRIGWDEVAELVTESYCVLAPRKLVALVDRPPEASG